MFAIKFIHVYELRFCNRMHCIECMWPPFDIVGKKVTVCFYGLFKLFILHVIIYMCMKLVFQHRKGVVLIDADNQKRKLYSLIYCRLELQSMDNKSMV